MTVETWETILPQEAVGKPFSFVAAAAFLPSLNIFRQSECVPAFVRSTSSDIGTINLLVIDVSSVSNQTWRDAVHCISIGITGIQIGGVQSVLSLWGSNRDVGILSAG